MQLSHTATVSLMEIKRGKLNPKVLMWLRFYYSGRSLYVCDLVLIYIHLSNFKSARET